jgi:hypothetical protein
MFSPQSPEREYPYHLPYWHVGAGVVFGFVGCYIVWYSFDLIAHRVYHEVELPSRFCLPPIGLKGSAALAVKRFGLLFGCFIALLMAFSIFVFLVTPKWVRLTAEGIAGPLSYGSRIIYMPFREVTDCYFRYRYPVKWTPLQYWRDQVSGSPARLACLEVCSSRDRIRIEPEYMHRDDFIELCATVLAATQHNMAGGGLRQAFGRLEEAWRSGDATGRLRVARNSIDKGLGVTTTTRGLVFRWKLGAKFIQFDSSGTPDAHDAMPTVADVSTENRLHPALVDGCFIRLHPALVDGSLILLELRPERISDALRAGLQIAAWQVGVT